MIDLDEVINGDKGKVQAFGISAAYDLLDFIERQNIILKTVEGLFLNNAPHLFMALKELMSQAKSDWYCSTSCERIVHTNTSPPQLQCQSRPLESQWRM